MREMRLERSPPRGLRAQVGRVLQNLRHRHQRLDDLALAFAIHPGGPAILNQIRSKLGIEESQIALSRKVLYEHGNMASATAPHIWQAIVESPAIPVGSKVLSMAFGPGLTVIGALFEKV